MEIRDLLQERAKLVKEAENFLDEHTAKDGTLSAEDNETYRKMDEKILALTTTIERKQTLALRKAEWNKPTSEPVLNKPGAADNKVGRASDEYKKAFVSAIRSNFQHVNNVLQEGVAASGGYLVPAEWDSRLIDEVAKECVMRQLATQFTTNGEHKLNLAKSKPEAVWVAESEALTFDNATFDQITFDAYKLIAKIAVTNELLSDNAYDLESWLIEKFGEAIGESEEDAFLNGDGNGKPTGLFVEAVTDVQTTNGNSVSGDDLINLVYSLRNGYRSKAAFIMNDRTLAQIRKIKDQNQAYVWQPSYAAGEPDRLLGYPIYSSAFAPIAESGKAFIAFGDFSYYNIADRGERSVRRLYELLAGNDQTAFLMSERVDGHLVQPDAVRLLKLK